VLRLVLVRLVLRLVLVPQVVRVLPLLVVSMVALLPGRELVLVPAVLVRLLPTAGLVRLVLLRLVER
jgi:hypothetical protein